MAEIQDRWNDVDTGNLRRRFLDESGCRSPFGVTEDGLCDFRGMRVDESLHQVVIENTDFGKAVVGNGQFMAVFRHCSFDAFLCDGSFGNDFRECNFCNANLKNAVIYGKLHDCDFSKANLSGVRGGNVRFEGCNFVETKLWRTSFFDCKFRCCRFVNCSIHSGSLAGTSFEDCEFENFDLGNAIRTRTTGLPTIQSG